MIYGTMYVMVHYMIRLRCRMVCCMITGIVRAMVWGYCMMCGTCVYWYVV